MSLRKRLQRLSSLVRSSEDLQAQKSPSRPSVPQSKVEVEDTEQYTIADWQPTQPHLWEWKTWQQALVFDPTEDDWQSQIEVLAEGIYRISIFQPQVLQALADEIASLEEWSKKHQVSLQPPNSMHDYGIEMSLMGLNDLWQHFTTEIADTIVKVLFPELPVGQIDHHHAFSVTYGSNHNRSLGFHADDSEVTFNFCLGGDFIGSDLYFQGRRCFNHLQTPHRPEEHLEIEQIPGTCIVHVGLHRHGVLPILEGSRRSLIVWTKSSDYRKREGRSECDDFCGVN